MAWTLLLGFVVVHARVRLADRAPLPVGRACATRSDEGLESPSPSAEPRRPRVSRTSATSSCGATPSSSAASLAAVPAQRRHRHERGSRRHEPWTTIDGAPDDDERAAVTRRSRLVRRVNAAPRAGELAASVGARDRRPPLGFLVYKGLTSADRLLQDRQQAVAQRARSATPTFRLEGTVVHGSVHRVAMLYRFAVEIRQGGATVHGRQHRRPAAAVPAGHPGRGRRPFRRRDAIVFSSNQIMVKHSAPYIAAHPNRVKRERPDRPAEPVNAVLGQIGVAARPRLGGRAASASSVLGLDSTARRWLDGRPAGGLRCARRRPARDGRDGARPHHPRLLARLRRRQQRPVTPLLYSITGHVVGAAGLDPAVGARPRRLPRRSSPGASGTRPPTRSWRGRLLVGLVVAAFFFGLMAGPANPFVTIVRAGPPPTALGPNALLQDNVLIAFHPVVPVSRARRVHHPVRLRHRLRSSRGGSARAGSSRPGAARSFAWAFLTVGIVLGAWWSYQVLGWGGFWAWDPVENAALLPWLVRDRLPALGHGAGATRPAPGLEPLPPRSPPTRSRSSARSSPVRACSCPSTPSRTRRASGRVLLGFFGAVVATGVGPDRLAGRPAALAGLDRLARLARGRVPREQLAVRGVRRRRAHRHGLPAVRARPGQPGDPGRHPVLRLHHRPDRLRAALLHGGGPGVAVRRRHRDRSCVRGSPCRHGLASRSSPVA